MGQYNKKYGILRTLVYFLDDEEFVKADINNQALLLNEFESFWLLTKIFNNMDKLDNNFMKELVNFIDYEGDENLSIGSNYNDNDKIKIYRNFVLLVNGLGEGCFSFKHFPINDNNMINIYYKAINELTPDKKNKLIEMLTLGDDDGIIWTTTTDNGKTLTVRNKGSEISFIRGESNHIDILNILVVEDEINKKFPITFHVVDYDSKKLFFQRTDNSDYFQMIDLFIANKDEIAEEINTTYLAEAFF